MWSKRLLLFVTTTIQECFSSTVSTDAPVNCNFVKISWELIEKYVTHECLWYMYIHFSPKELFRKVLRFKIKCWDTTCSEYTLILFSENLISHHIKSSHSKDKPIIWKMINDGQKFQLIFLSFEWLISALDKIIANNSRCQVSALILQWY